MRRIGIAAALLAVVALAIAAGAGAFGGNSYPPQGAAPPPTAAELKELGRMALRTATLAGDPHPTGAVVVPTTRQIAVRVSSGDQVFDSNPPSYFVVLVGHFTPDVSVPAGAREPTGTFLSMTIDARTNQGMDSGLGDRMPDLYAMGAPEPLPLPTSVG